MAPRRSGRRSTRSGALRSPTPPPPLEASDNEKRDSNMEAGTPQYPPEDNGDGADDVEDVDGDEGEEGEDGEDGEEADEGEDAVDEGEQGDNEQDSSPAPQSPQTLSRSRGSRTSFPPPLQKRRPGRPPKYPRPHLDGSDREGSDATPRRRGGFRGGRGFGGGRWKNKNLQRQQAMPIDRDGEQLEVENDEAKMPDDPEGEKKVSKDGHLQNGREYRVRTFTIDGRDNRLYMLSTEPARCMGFRDSYLFFQKHKMLYKIILSDDEKMDLIERDLMPHSYKGRSIGVVTARSVFREFGAKIIIAGRKIIDDYRVADMRAEGEVEGEIAVPEDVLPGPGEEYNRNQYVAWHGASAVYHTNAPTLPVPGYKMEAKKRKVTVTGSNWMLEHAREASRFNSHLAAVRRETLNGIYEVHTNQMHFPRIMQPTHARWEQLDNSVRASTPPNGCPSLETLVLSKTCITNGQDASNSIDAISQSRPQSQQAEASSAKPLPSADVASKSIFPTLTSFQRRHLATIDTVYVSPRQSGLGTPGHDAPSRLLPGAGPGLLEVAPEVVDALPMECRAAFEEARDEEVFWRAQWGTEMTDGLRSDPRVAYHGV